MQGRQETQPFKEPGRVADTSSSVSSIDRHIGDTEEATRLVTEPSPLSAQTVDRDQQDRRMDRWMTQRDEVLQSNLRHKDRAFEALKLLQRVEEAYRAVGLYLHFNQFCTHKDVTLRNASSKAWQDLHTEYMKESAAMVEAIYEDGDMALPPELQGLIFAPRDGMNVEQERAHCIAIAVKLRQWLLKVRQDLDGQFKVALSRAEIAIEMLVHVHSERPRE